MNATAASAELRRVRVRITGAVQGVGFRPFVYRLARQYTVAGWIANDAAGVILEAEAAGATLEHFLLALRTELPPNAAIHTLDTETIPSQRDGEFRIEHSDGAGTRTAVMLPDLATCDDCLAEVRSRDDRRAAYAFTNCTNCGPRFSIIRDLPYDRPRTTMHAFTMCDACAHEYADPADRRFHAQPNACPDCGPSVSLVKADGTRIRTGDPIGLAADALAAGAIVAVKGIGGFHLMVDARSTEAVTALRERKHRPAKPLAVMAASVEQARRFVHVDAAADALLRSPAAPVVLLPRRPTHAAYVTGAPPLELAPGIAPDNPTIGVMLAAAPLHHLLLASFGGPVVATSGNLAEEPICTDNAEALERLGGIAELFLMHDRPIERHVDDSVVMIADDDVRMIRRARGYAPLPIMLRDPVPPVLALGAHLKNTIALTRDRQAFISQHIGDLESPQSQAAFERVIADFMRMYEVRPHVIVHDLHPDYASTHAARRLSATLDVPAFAVQHHHAHLASCLAENHATHAALGIIWDGTGYGTDGTIWGGEFLVGDALEFRRAASLMPFQLPGGEAAVREPRRTALALTAAACDSGALDGALPWQLADVTRRSLMHMIHTGLNTPMTTSMGRLFDGVAALLGLCEHVTFSGEAAIRLEHVADVTERGAYELPWIAPDEFRHTYPLATDCAPLLLDWRPMLLEVLGDIRRGVPVARISARFHNALVNGAVRQAQLAGMDAVVLSGGCFHNRWLLERTAAQLRHHGFRVLQHRSVPASDGGISFGQAAVAAAHLQAGRIPLHAN